MRRPCRSLVELITGSLPPLHDVVLDGPQRELLDSLPADYRRFLEQHNGGELPEFALAFDTRVPFRTEKVDRPSRNDGVREFFGFRSSRDDEGPADLLERRVLHDSEEFLPAGIIAIAICAQSSLVCLSVRRNHFGRVYYWDWYWRYPWCKWFFDQRIDYVASRYPDSKTILKAPAHPRYWETVDAFNYATIVPLAPSFDAWIASCYDAREDEDEAE